MRQWTKKCMAGVLALVMAAGALTACEAYIPKTSGTDNASGAAVSEEVNKGQETKEEANKKSERAAGLKYETGNTYSDLIDLDMQSSRAFYVSYRFRYAEYYYIYQISPDGKKLKETGIKSENNITLISVDSNWVYYGIGKKIYRVPIVAKKKSEILDIEKKECVVKNCRAEDAFTDEQKLYYMTDEDITKVSKKRVKEGIQIHCLDLVTGEERVCPENILNTGDYDIYKEYKEIDAYPEYYITENYIYYMGFFPDYLYQLNKHTLELSVIDALDDLEKCEDDCDCISSVVVTENGDCIWYVKVVAGNENCEYRICRYDVKRQSKKEICTQAECLDVICKEEKINVGSVDYLSIEDIVHFDEDKIYIQYEIGFVEKKKVVDGRKGVIVYSFSENQMEPLSELCKFYRMHYEEEEDDDEIYRDSSVSLEGYLKEEQQFLLCVDDDLDSDEDKSWYAIYDFATKKTKRISDKKVEKLFNKIMEANMTTYSRKKYEKG